MEPRQPSPLEMLISLAATALTVWAIIPPSDRAMIRMRAAYHSRRALAVLAQREGRAGLSQEARAGNPRPALHRYNAAYWLSVARDKLGEAMRP